MSSTRRPPLRRRQSDRTAATRAVLLRVATIRFIERGFAGVAAEELAAEAHLTRGALYHHFGSKEGLFDAVHEALHEEIASHITRAAARARDPWDALVAGSIAFLDACADSRYQRVVLLDAPAVLGWERWREVDAAHGLGLLKTGLREAMTAGAIRRQPIDALAHLLSGAMNEAGMWIARADDPLRARRDATTALRTLMGALRL